MNVAESGALARHPERTIEDLQPADNFPDLLRQLVDLPDITIEQSRFRRKVFTNDDLGRQIMQLLFDLKKQEQGDSINLYVKIEEGSEELLKDLAPYGHFLYVVIETIRNIYEKGRIQTGFTHGKSKIFTDELIASCQGPASEVHQSHLKNNPHLQLIEPEITNTQASILDRVRSALGSIFR